MQEEKTKRISEFFSGSAKRKPATRIFDNFPDGSTPPCSAKKRRTCPREEKGQMALDAGQAKIGAQSCDKCGMAYSVDVSGDVADHEKYCNGDERRSSLVVNRKTLDGWVKNILSLKPGHAAYPLTGTCTIVLKVERSCTVENLKAKVEEVVKTQVNSSLGFTEEGSMWDSNLSSTYTHPTPSSSQSLLVLSPSNHSFVLNRPQRKAYVAIVRDENRKCSIAGVVIAEAVYRAIDVDKEKWIRADRLMGVNRLWVNEEMRGRGIATKMIDTARESFFSLSIPRSRVVFSEPTKDGEKFARSYVKNDEGRLLVYNLGNGEEWKEIMKKMIEIRRRSQTITVEEREEEKEEEDKETSTVDERREESENGVDEDRSDTLSESHT